MSNSPETTKAYFEQLLVLLKDKSIKVSEWAAQVMEDFPGTESVADLESAKEQASRKA